MRYFVVCLVVLVCVLAAVAQDRVIRIAQDDHAAGQFTHPIAQYTPDPPYPARARRAGVTGSVVLRIMIGPDGCAHHIQVVRRLGWGLDQAAILAVRAWRFRRPSGVNAGVPARIEMSFSPNMIDRPLSDLTPCTEMR